MGCDWIDAGDVYIGFEFPFHTVFENTIFERLDELPQDEDDDEEDEEKDKEEEESHDEEDEDESGKKPQKFLLAEWKAYVDINCPELVGKDIKPFIGPTSLPGTYEKTVYTNSCKVVFGYMLTMKHERRENGDTLCVFPEICFPANLNEICKQFIKSIQSDTKRKKAKTSHKYADAEGKDSNEEVNPVMVHFLT